MHKIIQADRDAAKALLEQQELRYHKDGTFRDWENTVQAFARHRIAHQWNTLEAILYTASTIEAVELLLERGKAGISEDGYLTLVHDKPQPLARCMGGRFCNHQPGTCTATAGQTPTPTVKDSLTGDVAELVEALERCKAPSPSLVAAKLTELAAEVQRLRAEKD